MGTKIWGPLGWMTLHSISSLYPEEPTQTDRAIVNEFINCFYETIACPHCKTHFKLMFMRYKSTNPDWNSSRRNFFLFICRAHNTVNRRLDKPIHKTVLECIDSLKTATKTRSTKEFRRAYIDYLVGVWGRRPDAEGLMMVGFVKKLMKINDEYCNVRDTGSYETLQIQEGNVLEFIADDSKRYRASENVLDPIMYRNIRIGFKNGRFRLR